MRVRALVTIVAVTAAVALIVGGVFAVRSLSGGGDSEQSQDGDNASAPSAGDPDGGSVGGGSDGNPGTAPDDGSPMPPIDSRPSKPYNPREQRIDFYHQISPTRLKVHYTTGVPACYGKLGRIQVVESDSEVTIRLHKIPPKTTGDVACIEIAVQKIVTVILKRPLDDRTVVDAWTGQPVGTSRY